MTNHFEFSIPGIARVAGLLSLLTLLLQAPLAGQDFNRSAGFYGGLASFSDFNPNPGNLNDGSRATSLALESGWIVGVQGDNWFEFPNLGWRFNGAFTKRPLPTPAGSREIAVAMADLSLLVRFLPVRPDNVIQIFAAAGGGVVHYDLGNGEPITFPGHNARYLGRGESRGALVFGAGLDIITPLMMVGDPFGLRVEFMDHMVLASPFVPIQGRSEYGAVHNRRIVVTAFTGFDFLW